MLAHLEKLRTQTAECEIIRDLATHRNKRELFSRLAEHFKVLAAEIEKALANEARPRATPGPRASGDVIAG
jgi:hypothetical protein